VRERAGTPEGDERRVRPALTLAEALREHDTGAYDEGTDTGTTTTGVRDLCRTRQEACVGTGRVAVGNWKQVRQDSHAARRSMGRAAL
jgi:hypothetical protein